MESSCRAVLFQTNYPENNAESKRCTNTDKTNSVVHDLEKVAIIEFYEDEHFQWECYIYFCHVWDGDLKETEEMGAAYAFNITNMPYYKMWHADKTWLPLVCAG